MKANATLHKSVQPSQKGSINMRIEDHTRRLIDEAASILGKTRTEFMIDSARTLATDVVLDQRYFVLQQENYDAFVDALNMAPQNNTKLQALLQRKPIWATK
jgi:uncharacterized protein (DUF1778 family)